MPRFPYTLPQAIAKHLSLIAGSEIEAPCDAVPYRHRARRVNASIARVGRFLAEWYEEHWDGGVALPQVRSADEVADALLDLHRRSPMCPGFSHGDLEHLRGCASCKEHLTALLVTVVRDLQWSNAGPQRDVFRHYIANHVKCIRIDCDKESIPVPAETSSQRAMALEAAGDMHFVGFYVRRLSQELLTARMYKGCLLTAREYRAIVERAVSEVTARLQLSAAPEKKTMVS